MLLFDTDFQHSYSDSFGSVSFLILFNCLSLLNSQTLTKNAYGKPDNKKYNKVVEVVYICCKCSMEGVQEQMEAAPVRY